MSVLEIFEIWDIFEFYIVLVIICVLILEVFVVVLFFFKMRDVCELIVRYLWWRNGKFFRFLGLLECVLLERERVNYWGIVFLVLFLDFVEKFK